MSNDPQMRMDELDARADRSGYLALGGISLFFDTFRTLCSYSYSSSRLEFRVCSCWIVGSCGVLVAFRSAASCGWELSYKTLFGTRRINLSDIERAETRLFGTSKGKYRALIVYPRAGKMQKAIRVNIKVFSREDLGRLFDLLGSKFQGPRRIGVYTDESV